MSLKMYYKPYCPSISSRNRILEKNPFRKKKKKKTRSSKRVLKFDLNKKIWDIISEKYMIEMISF